MCKYFGPYIRLKAMDCYDRYGDYRAEHATTVIPLLPVHLKD